MNSSLLKAVFVVSLGLNCMIAGGLTYKYFFTAKNEGAYERPLSRRLPGRDLSPGIRKRGRGLGRRMRQERMEIGQMQDRLVELLIQAEPDRTEINAMLEEIRQSRAKLQQFIMDRILNEIRDLTLEQKRAYLSNLKGSMRGRGMMGMGKGKGRRKGGGRRQNRNFPPQ